MRKWFNGVMRIISTVVGLLMIASGCVWMMQGTGIGPESIMRGFMAGDIRWAFYGALMALAGVGQVVWSNTRQSAG